MTAIQFRALGFFALLCLASAAGAEPPIAQGASERATPAVARVDFDRDDITAAWVSGIADPRTGRPLTLDDPVRVASISKLVVAIAVMRLEARGQIDLKADVSRYLGWTLRHPDHPEVPITLELLLSHRAGLTDAAGYVADTSSRLDAMVAAPGAWDPEHAPGTWFRYANLGFTVIGSVLERVTGTRFDTLMHELVLAPLDLDACFNWTTCDDATIARAVVLRDHLGNVRLDDVGGARPVCPVLAAADGSCRLDAAPGDNGGLFSPQGGLRISVRGLARIGQMLLADGKLAEERFLAPSAVAALVRPRWIWNGANGAPYEGDLMPAHGALFCRYGLAVQTLGPPLAGCGDDLFGDGRERVGHPGEAYGLVSGLWLDRQRGTGTAWFVVGADLSVPGVDSAFYRAEEELARRMLPP